MTKQLTSRQAGLILVVAIVANKLIMLPSILSFHTFQDAWLAFLMSFAIDFLFCMIFVYFLQKLDKPILQILQQKYGRVVAIIFGLCVAIVFLLKSAEMFGECYLFFDSVMYIEIDKYIFSGCFLALTLYFSSRKFRTVGRTNELMFFLFATAIGFCLFLSIDSTDPSRIFPIGASGFGAISNAVFRHNLWFGDFLLLFLFVGDVQKVKHTNAKILWGYLVGELIVLIFVFLFVGTFGRTAQLHRTAIIDMTEYRPRLASEGRINWVIDLIYPIFALIGLGIYANAGVYALDFCINTRKKTNIVAVLIFSALLLSIAIVLRSSQQKLYDFATQYFCYFSFAVQYLMPLVLIFMVSKKENAK